jgi:hypothetical protein
LVVAPTTAARMAEADEAFREKIVDAMEQAAGSLDLVLDLSDLVYLGNDDLLVVIAGVAGFEDEASSDPVFRADIGLMYASQETEVRFGDGEVGSRLPTGFHAVRVEVNQARNAHDPGVTILEAVASSEMPAIALPITLLPPSARRTLTACQAISESGDAEVLVLGWHGRKFSVEVELYRAAARPSDV